MPGWSPVWLSWLRCSRYFPTLGLTLGVLLSVYGLRRFLLKRDSWVILGMMTLIPAAYYLASIGSRSGGYFSFWTLSMMSLVTKGFMYAGWVGILNRLYGLAVIGTGLLGVVIARPRARGLLAGFWAGYILFGLTFPYQIHTHEYYSLIVLPVLALSLAPAGELIARHIQADGGWQRVAAATLVIAAVIYPAWLDRNMVLETQTTADYRAWEIMGEELPRDGAIIALTHDYGNYLAYYAFRKVDLWPYTEDLQVQAYRGSGKVTDFQAYFDQLTAGHKYFLVTQFAQLDAQPELKDILSIHYPLAREGDGYVLYDLSGKK